MSFKLLAIRPLKGCNKRFLKNLVEDQVYQFYNDYDFLFRDNNIEDEVIGIKKKKQTVPENLYDSDKLEINISAIVGKNGSGKSSIVELFYVSFYNLSILKRLLNRRKTKKTTDIIRNKIEKSESKIKSEYSKIFRKNDKNEFIYEEEFIKVNNFLYDLDEDKNADDYQIIEFLKLSNFIVKEIRVEIFFLIENEYFKLKINDKKAQLFLFSEEKKGFVLKNISNLLKNKFFYSLAINYSFYALNSNELGSWVKNVFHKNDSYQTPIVLNPMRTFGNIDVNVETDLLKSRLLFNLISPFVVEESINSQYLIHNKIPHKINFKLNKRKLLDEDQIENKVKPSSKINTDIYKEKHYPIIKKVFELDGIDDNDYLNGIALEYIFKKIISIVNKYSSYRNFNFSFDIDEFDKVKFEKILRFMKNDQSHITLKLRQSLNFLKYDTIIHEKYNEKESFFQLDIKDDLAKSLGINLKKIVDKKNKRKVSLTEILPPSFFDYEIIFEDGSEFSLLSSGEKQKVYSINSVLYHLLNLNSVFNNPDINLKRYKYVNIIFDEIELYYHPDMQRTFINDLLNDIKKINIPFIKGINIIFITHSPFILSDISNSNIIFLKVDKEDNRSKQIKNKDKTFGANVHDLLSDSFFMEKKGYIGEFAKIKIKSAIEYLENYPIEDKNWNSESVKQFIDIISEPLIRNSLNELYYNKILNSISDKEKEVKRLIKLIELEKNK